nr:pseudouridine synthase [Desulfocicer vacuolatum]
MRLQKFLSQAGVCSRRQGEVFISQGRVTVNGIVVTTPGTKVVPGVDLVSFDGTAVEMAQDKALTYIALNKPVGVVSSCVRQGRESIILDLVNVPQRIYPVGRLDKDSCGLLLLTDDGELHNRLSHPSFNHEKEYAVTTVKPVSRGALEKMARGIVLDGKRTRKARVWRTGSHDFGIVLKQGLNRQIRRMVTKTGNGVSHLKRVRMGRVTLGNLDLGKWRHLTPGEVKSLQSSPGKSHT